MFPHVDYIQNMSFIFLQSGQIRYPGGADRYLTIAKHGEVVICRGSKIISASPHGLDLFKRALEDVQNRLDQHGFVASVLYGLLDAALKEYRSIFNEIEREVTMIGSTPRSKLPATSSRGCTSSTRRSPGSHPTCCTSRNSSGVATSRSVPLEGWGSSQDDFKSLQDETSYLSDIADDVLDGVHTLIELYINQSSFETNRILKILAVITAFSIIPSAVGSALGMNLLDVPYPFDLWQIVTVIGFLMAFIAYCFVKLGWLRP